MTCFTTQISFTTQVSFFLVHQELQSSAPSLPSTHNTFSSHNIFSSHKSIFKKNIITHHTDTVLITLISNFELSSHRAFFGSRKNSTFSDVYGSHRTPSVSSSNIHHSFHQKLHPWLALIPIVRTFSTQDQRCTNTHSKRRNMQSEDRTIFCVLLIHENRKYIHTRPTP